MTSETELEHLERLAAGKRVEAVIHEDLLNVDAAIEVQQFSLWYGKRPTLQDITLPIPHGCVTALVGPSGCGQVHVVA